jgi:hypothetical protein
MKRGERGGGDIEILCQNLLNLSPLLPPLCQADNYTVTIDTVHHNRIYTLIEESTEATTLVQ